MMNDDEIIAVVQAHKEGKRVQFKYQPTEDSDYEWFDVDHERIWFFDKYLYRVAPEPRKPRRWIVYTDDQGMLRNDPMGHSPKLFIVEEVIE